MARLSRLYAPRVPQLAQARFARTLTTPDGAIPSAALERIRCWLAEEASQVPMALHAWAVLPDRITLLATPADIQSISHLMQGMGRRMGSGLLQTRVFEGRYHNALLEPGRWVLPAMVWVETLAVRTGQVATATQWPWSSASDHAGQRSAFLQGVRIAPGSLPLLTDHPDYWHEGDTPFARQAAWRQLLANGLEEARRQPIEAALHGQWALGERIFLAHLGKLASRRVSPAPRGRPRKDRSA